ncbi:pectinesterase family protein [Phnomibacter sp. MR]|uniref:pectinesterase family protein n=1 Tax=Phnomibacter sp. MR TaxID=3042318 RepID=UPI003A8060B3
MMKRFSMIVMLLFVAVAALQAQTSNPQQYKYIFAVAQDGSGDYTSIGEAIKAMRGYPLAPITLYIKNGVYKEKLEILANNTDISMIGESVEGTIITFDDYSGKPYEKGKHGTFSSYTVKVSGNRFTAQNITFENSSGRVGQALALYVDADQALFINCRFVGNQDTIFTGGELCRQYFLKCDIEGTTDFIFGPATAVFDSCNIRIKVNSYITAASTTAGKQFGYVFRHCNITADSSVTKFYLGRPWRAHAKTVFMYCELPAQLAPVGWHNWDNPANEQTTFYAEYKNIGPGAATAQRVPWSKQLTKKEARQYSLQNIFSGPQIGRFSTGLFFENTQSIPFVWPGKTSGK